MAIDFDQLARSLEGLVIFRSLRKDPVFMALTGLVHALFEGKNIVPPCSDLAAALYESGDNLTDYIVNAVLENENVYLVRRAQHKEVPAVIASCFKHEIEVLQQVSQITLKSIRRESGYDEFLPEWNTSPVDLAALYEERASQISMHGYGMFAKYHTFTLQGSELVPVENPDRIDLSELYGYELQRREVLDNTTAFLKGKPAVDILLYGDTGTGKSSTVKAVVNYCRDQGLRLVELKKNQLHQIPELIDRLSQNPLKFILFIEDLSFAQEEEFAALKALLKGAVTSRTDNVAIYATSNRRRTAVEPASDPAGDDMQEMLSLSERFGLTVTFLRPSKKEYQAIIRELAVQYRLEMEPIELLEKAEAFAIGKNGYSPRVAKQFIELMKAASD